MKTLLAAVFIFLLLTGATEYVEPVGERTRVYWMADSTGNEPTRPTWVTVDTSTARSVWFYFTPSSRNKNTQHIDHTGYSTIIMSFDSTSGQTPIVANRDSVDIVLTYLVWDRADLRYEEVSIPVSGDTTHVRTDWKWRPGHADDKYQLSYVVNHRAGIAGFKLTVTPNLTTQPFRFKAEAWLTEDR
jgi:hypothetical protein